MEAILIVAFIAAVTVTLFVAIAVGLKIASWILGI